MEEQIDLAYGVVGALHIHPELNKHVFDQVQASQSTCQAFCCCQGPLWKIACKLSCNWHPQLCGGFWVIDVELRGKAPRCPADSTNNIIKPLYSK